MAETATLLKDSLAAHRNALQARIRHSSVLALALLITARDLRVEANTQDPTHLDPAWSDERAKYFQLDINTQLLAFYHDMLP